MKNIVMTCCINYNYEIFERFIGSLFDSTDNIDLVIFIGENDVEHILKLKKTYENIIYSIIDNKNIHIVNYRFYLYYDFLNKNKNNYNYIFICDSRDVLFQKNIFNHSILSSKYDLYIFEEESQNITIDKCKFNSLYIQKSGLDINDLVYNKPILCVGTILGNENGIMEYLEKFVYILLNEVEEENRSYYGTDSGINYKIIYGDLLKNINIYICKNNEKLVYTMAFPNYLNQIDYSILLNNKQQICYNGDVCCCVHQYDRLNDEIKKQMSIKYNYIL
tara:strand:- start:297 stop:1127 length:831 start_codon:yes stop_codon:yes gene_type:complete